MRTHVTVIPSDQNIIVDNQALHLSFEAPDTMHALQWHNTAGHIEWTDAPNQPLDKKDYATYVLPFVQKWETEKQRLEEEANRPLPLSQVKEMKLAELENTYEAALSGAIALADPAPTIVVVEAALWAVEDKEGLQFMREKIQKDYAQYKTAIMASSTLEELKKVVFSFKF